MYGNGSWHLFCFQEAEYLSKYGPQKKERVAEVAPEKQEEKQEEQEEDLTTPNLYPLPREEVVRRFRELLQPILVFGGWSS